MCLNPPTRSDDIDAVCRALQWLDEFTYYPIHVQKEFGREAFFESYGPNRIIFKEGNHSDFLYFVLKGTLILRGQDGTTIMSKGRKMCSIDAVFLVCIFVYTI